MQSSHYIHQNLVQMKWPAQIISFATHPYQFTSYHLTFATSQASELPTRLLESRAGTAWEASQLLNFLFYLNNFSLWISLASLFKSISYFFLLALCVASEVYPDWHLGKNGKSSYFIYVCQVPFVVRNVFPCHLQLSTIFCFVQEQFYPLLPKNEVSL